MKKYLLLLLCLPLWSCGEMLSAMSNVAAGSGSVCEYYVAETSLYYDGEWQDDRILTTSDDGTDVENLEDQWLSSRTEGYLNLYQFNTYYVTSPYTGGEYKIYVYCSQWAQQQQSSYGYY